MSDPKHASIAIVERSEPQQMHPLVKAAIDGARPEDLRELLALQRDWEANEARKAFTRALVSLKGDMPTVIDRDRLVDHETKAGGRKRFRHASLAAAMDAVTPHLTAHGFSLAWTPSTQGSSVTVLCRLTHAEGHHEETSISAPIDTSGSKSPAQGVASTITLLSRYTALSLLGIATADMREPTGEPSPPDPDRVDTARNLRAVGRLRAHGRTREDAETVIGRPVAEWTAADLARLSEWVREPAEDQREPGDD